MNLYPKTLLTVAILLVASSSMAQEQYHSPDPNLMARLSYDNSGVVREGNVQHMCVAVSGDGDYRIVRSLDDGQTQRLHGKMPKEEFRQLKMLLGAPDFRSLSGNHGGLIRQEAEGFRAEIPHRENGAQRLQWLNADGENLFPGSVAKVVKWLKQFEPTDGKSFEYAEYPDVCPSGGLRLLQPSEAANSRH